MRSMELVGRERMEAAVRLNNRYAAAHLVVILTKLSNNFPFGAKPVTMMSRMLRINWGFLFMKLASLKTNSSTVMTNTG